ncbi:hypothetical protein BRD00_15255 [Halobacteriales archaeon QS_8_69_26]|nr:MAG: hypothetical protein BRD00_15255 [Halobacteriales archaeon QS_8_69_26]
MTVALVGVGADASNADPVAPLYDDGTFEFIPAPSPGGSGGTSERRTFGNTRLRHQDSVMGEFLESIKPLGDDGPDITGVNLNNWPLHYNPNFVSLTYGATGEDEAFVEALRSLEPGDGVAFYSVLEPEGGGAKHRYLIGYFAVEGVVDFQALDRDGGEAAFGDLSEPERRALVEDHGENAYAKVYRETGELPDGDDLVIVEGTDPGTMLSEAVQISEHGGGGHYYLTDDLQEGLSPEEGGDDKNAYLGGDHQAHVLDVSLEEFRDVVE